MQIRERQPSVASNVLKCVRFKAESMDMAVLIQKQQQKVLTIRNPVVKESALRFFYPYFYLIINSSILRIVFLSNRSTLGKEKDPEDVYIGQLLDKGK